MMLIKGSLRPSDSFSDWGRGAIGHQPSGKVPRWVDCDYLEFRNVWLPKFEHGELPPCTDEEWRRIMGMLRQTPVVTA